MRVGDRVICVDANDNLFDANLTLGKIYIIRRTLDGVIGLEIMGDTGKIQVYFANRFEPITNTRTFLEEI